MYKHAGLKCLICKDKIFSEYRHDYRSCQCGNATVDGGYDYFRYGYADKEKIKIIYRKEKDRRKSNKQATEYLQKLTREYEDA